jgi:hypothetical protein
MGWKVLAGFVLCLLVQACRGAHPSTTPLANEGEGGEKGAPEAGGQGGEGDLGGAAGTVGEAGGGGTPEAGAGGSNEGGDSGAPGQVLSEIPKVDESELPEPVQRVGFIELEPASYTAPVEGPEELRSHQTRLFYAFIPAEEDAKSKPVFVFFNGGPGSTSMLLFSFGTGPLTLNADDLAAAPRMNPHSFTKLGSLLYIDARHAGFSYSTTEHPELEEDRAAAVAGGSMNTAVDGADFVRVLLRVLRQQPALQNNPVVIVGESYGGTRASIMLGLLLDPRGNYGYQDASLVAELEAHYGAVFPGIPPQQLTAAERALQFGWQVLIQPFMLGSAQADAQAAIAEQALEAMASELGMSVEEVSAQCGYDVSRPEAWCADIETAVSQNVTSPARFLELFGTRPELVPGLRASERLDAFRLVTQSGGTPDSAALVEELGAISVWDRYFQFSAQAPNDGFRRAFGSPAYGALFLRATRHVNTMITNARWDTVVMSESIVPALNDLVPLFSQPWFVQAEYVESGQDPPTRARLHFLAHDEIGPAAVRELYMPRYDQGGHFVSVTEPGKLFADVAAFLSETGLQASP